LSTEINACQNITEEEVLALYNQKPWFMFCVLINWLGTLVVRLLNYITKTEYYSFAQLVLLQRYFEFIVNVVISLI